MRRSPSMAPPPVAQHVVSHDGTRIELLALGSGPPIVFVHGSLTTGREWLPVASLLADRFTCLVMHRRGRATGHDQAAHPLAAGCDRIAAPIAPSRGEGDIV